MKNPSGLQKLSPLVLVVIIFSFFMYPSEAFPQIAPPLQEQEEFTEQQKQQLLDFYWQISQRLVHEGQFEQALFQAQRIYDIDPDNAQVADFIARITRRRLAEPSLSEREQMTKRFIQEQEQFSRGSIEGTYLPQEQIADDSLKKKTDISGSRPVSAVRQTPQTEPLFSDLDDFVAVERPKKIRVQKEAVTEYVPDKDKSVLVADAVSQRSKRAIRTDSQESGEATSTFRPLPVKDTAAVQKSLNEARELMEKKDFDKALFTVNEVLISNPDSDKAIELKNIIMEKRQQEYRDLYRDTRKQKAEIFRKKHIDETVERAVDTLHDIEEQEQMILKIQQERLTERARREELGERRIRDDVRKRIEAQETSELNTILTEVDESQFYQRFKEYDAQQREEEQRQRRQLHSFLLRAEGLMEMGKYNEAAVYINNVFMIDPTNARAQKIRVRLEDEILKKEQRDQDIEDKLFRKEKKEYLKIKQNIQKKKIRELLKNANDLFKQEEWIHARQEAQKALYLDPTHRSAKRVMKKIDKKLIEVQEEIASREDVVQEKRTYAMDEALQEAAHAVEVEIVTEKKDSIDIDEQVTILMHEADRKIQRRADFQGALIDLNRAAALAPANKAVREKIKETRELKRKKDMGIYEPQVKSGMLSHADAQGSVSTVERTDETVITIAQQEAADKEKRWQEFNRAKQIEERAQEKIYQEKVREYIQAAQKYLDQRDFSAAKKEVERIFYFDPQNDLAKDMLKRIEDYEIQSRKLPETPITLDKEFERGVELEKLKTALQKTVDSHSVIDAGKTPQEEEATRKKAIKSLLKESRRLYKQKRYFEARQKTEAVFSLESNNEKASALLDKINESMVKEREKERDKVRERQRKEINARLDSYASEVHQLHTQGRYTEAAILIEKSLLLDPSNKYFEELKAINARGAKEQIRFENSPQEEKKNLVNQGIKQYIQGNYVEAKRYFEKVLEIDPNDEKALNSIAKLDQKISTLQLGQ
jgi:hypothetical protein